MKQYDFEKFKGLCLDILAQSDNCQESQICFRAATNMTELVLAWKQFWAGVLREVPEQVTRAFSDLYSVYGEDINAAGLYYNEAPKNMSGCTILVGDCREVLSLVGTNRVYVVGDAQINAFDNVVVQCNCAMAVLNIYDHATAIMDGGTCSAHDRATINGKGHFYSYDAASVYISGGTLRDNGHKLIIAYNDAIIKSFTNKNIELKDNAELIIE